MGLPDVKGVCGTGKMRRPHSPQHNQHDLLEMLIRLPPGPGWPEPSIPLTPPQHTQYFTWTGPSTHSPLTPNLLHWLPKPSLPGDPASQSLPPRRASPGLVCIAVHYSRTLCIHHDCELHNHLYLPYTSQHPGHSSTW